MGQEVQPAAGPRLLPGETVLYEVDGLNLVTTYHVRTEKVAEGVTAWWTTNEDGVVRLTQFRVLASLSYLKAIEHLSCGRVVAILETPPRVTAIAPPLFSKAKSSSGLTRHEARLLLAGGLALDITLPYPEKPDATSHAAFLARSERLSLLLATALVRLGGGDEAAALIAAAETEAIARRRRQD